MGGGKEKIAAQMTNGQLPLELPCTPPPPLGHTGHAPLWAKFAESAERKHIWLSPARYHAVLLIHSCPLSVSLSIWFLVTIQL